MCNSTTKAYQVDERLYENLSHRVGHKPVDVGLNAAKSDSSCELTKGVKATSQAVSALVRTCSANGVPAITKTGTEMSAAYSVSIDICVVERRGQHAVGEDPMLPQSAACLHLKHQEIVMFARAHHCIGRSCAIQNLHETAVHSLNISAMLVCMHSARRTH